MRVEERQVQEILDNLKAEYGDDCALWGPDRFYNGYWYIQVAETNSWGNYVNLKIHGNDPARCVLEKRDRLGYWVEEPHESVDAMLAAIPKTLVALRAQREW